jgi:uncharacterized damage-inducible protein DinB
MTGGQDSGFRGWNPRRESGMGREADTYARELRWLLEQIAQAISGIDERQLAWRPPAAQANSAAAIAAHVLSATRVYALGFGCGRPVTRDRPAEFAATTVDAPRLTAALRALTDEVEAAFAGLPAERLEEQFVPPQELWGTGEPHAITAREVIVESIRHAAIHLGELRLTRNLALAER